MHVGHPPRLPANLTIALIWRDMYRVHCEESLVHPCSQHVAVAEHGCLFKPPDPAARAQACANHSPNPPACWPYEEAGSGGAGGAGGAAANPPPDAPYLPHRILGTGPGGRSTPAPKSRLPLADVCGSHIDLLA